MSELGKVNGEMVLKVRVLIADDHEWMLDEIDNLLAADFDVVGRVRDGVSMVEAASRLQPDLIVTDLAMPGLTGIEASREILKARPTVPIVLLTMHNETEFVDDAFRAGVRAYVHKLAAGEELIPAIQYVLKGETFISRIFEKSTTP